MFSDNADVLTVPRHRDTHGRFGGARIIVLNDDHNTFEGVALTLARILPGIGVAEGRKLANMIHYQGQAEVWSGDLEVVELYWEQLHSSGLTMAPIEQG